MTRRRKKVIWVFISLIVIALISYYAYIEYYRFTFFSEAQGSILSTYTEQDYATSTLYKINDSEEYLFPVNTYRYITADPKNEKFFYGSDFDGIYHFEVEYIKNTDEQNELKIISSEVVINFENVENLEKYSLSYVRPIHTVSIIPDTNSISFIHSENIFKYDRDTKKLEIILENINEVDRRFTRVAQKMVWINDKEFFYIKYAKDNIKDDLGFKALVKYNVETKEEIRIAEDITNFGVSSNKKYLATIGPLNRLDKPSSVPKLIDIATGAEKEMDFLKREYFFETDNVQPSNDGKYILYSQGIQGTMLVYEFKYGFHYEANFSGVLYFEWSE